MKNKIDSLNFYSFIFIKSIKIGKRTFTSEDLLPEKRDIIFLLFELCY